MTKVRVDSTASRYLARLGQLPSLDRDEELALARRFKDGGDEAARNAFVRAHLRGVVAIAFRYRHYQIPVQELVAEGNFGLVRALTTYDPERGLRFMTYATHWIRAYIVEYVIRSWSIVGGGSGALRSKLFFKLRRERARLYNLLGEGEGADRVLAQRLGVSEQELQAMLRRVEGRDVRLDAPVKNDSSARFVDSLPSRERSQEDVVVGLETERRLRRTVHTALGVLNDRERYIAENRLLADAQEELSLSEIGRRFGVSRERARQLEARTKQKLRSRLKDLVEGDETLASFTEHAA